MNIKEFQNISWFSNLYASSDNEKEEVYGTHEELEYLLNEDPDSFFEPMYSDPYESWCLKYISESEQINPKVKKEIETWAEYVYKSLFSIIPSPELCGLVYDEVVAIIAHLHSNPLNISDFIFDKIQIYSKGRIPWGYKGVYPDGKWVII